MMTLATNWRLLYQRRFGWLFCCPIIVGFGVALFSEEGGRSASDNLQVGLFLWLAASAGALSAVIWKESMGKPHTFCLPKRKHETGAVSVISAMLLLFFLSSAWFGIRFPTQGVHAFTEATALFSYGCVAFLIGTWMVFQFSTGAAFMVLFVLPSFALSILYDLTATIADAFGHFLFTSPLVSIPAGIMAAICLSAHTWTQTGGIEQRRKLCNSADPGLAIFDFTKAFHINRIKERRSADKAPPPRVEVTRARREAFFLERLKRTHPNPAQQHLWGYLYRWVGNPKVMNRFTLPYQIIGLMALGVFFAWSGHSREAGVSMALFPQGIMIVMFGAFVPLPIMRPMTLTAGRKELLSTVLVLFLAYTLLAAGILLLLELSALGTSALVARFSSLAHDLSTPTLGWKALSSPLFILPILFLARLDLVRLGRAWVLGASFIGVGPLVLLMLLPPAYQAGLSIVMWTGCIWRYQRHFRRAHLASPDGDNPLDLMFRG